MVLNIKTKGFKEFEAAIKRNPRVVLNEAKKYIVRGLAQYNMGIIRDPWRIGGRGGGVPVSNDPRFPRSHQKQRSGNLRDTHKRKIQGLKGLIGPDQSRAEYAKFVHGGTRRMQARPWLDHVKKTKDGSIQKLYRAFLKNITRDLAK